MTIAIIVVLRIHVVFVERPQEIFGGPVCHLSSLLPRRFVCKAEVDALVDTGVDYLLRCIREASRASARNFLKPDRQILPLRMPPRR